ncbi:uncharacterized protein LOC125243274 [Megalobrama amblycephala]|uniref:uncharacterized protein LOC125243274 n=1 Tax=Megalobrama amblycephala TaxID=75352 RepID=UPI002014608B|nr:uncharacterized protein LOC125243274 [Megalobrama amblycephala]XP_048008867.1 uncharacterized protein LOC125243274 [Megalobrama amblycephala]XP_048008949.1 uncharacterized protein LOC125243274 [Megalobrama amblycephala]
MLQSSGKDLDTHLDVTPTATATLSHSRSKGSSITSTSTIPNATPSSQNDSYIPPYVRAIFMKLDMIELSVNNIQSILTKKISSVDVELEPLSRQLKTPKELEEASEKLKDSSHKGKVVQYLSLLGGKTPGDSVRRMMRKLGTNALWANYSLKGRKGKRNFQDLDLYTSIIQACHKIHPTTLQKTIENCIADTLRYAPHRGTQVDNEELCQGNEDTPEESALSQDKEAAPEESDMLEPAGSD